MCLFPQLQVEMQKVVVVAEVFSSPFSLSYILSSPGPTPLLSPPPLLLLSPSSPSHPSSSFAFAWLLDNQEIKSTIHHWHRDIAVNPAGLVLGVLMWELSRGTVWEAGGRRERRPLGEQGWVGTTARPCFPCIFSCTSLHHSGLPYELVRKLRGSLQSLEETVFLKHPKQSLFHSGPSSLWLKGTV